MNFKWSVRSKEDSLPYLLHITQTLSVQKDQGVALLGGVGNSQLPEWLVLCFFFLMLLKMLRNWNPCILSVGIQNTATMENSKEVPQNIKKYNYHMTYHASSGYLPERIEIRVLKRYWHSCTLGNNLKVD